MNEGKMGYFSKTVAEQIGISKDTLRTWSLKLEQDGAVFARNDNHHRIYYDRDIKAFLNMKELLDLQQPQIEVVKIVVEKLKKGVYDGLESSNPVEKTPSVERIQNEVATEEKRLELFKKELLEEFNKQHQMALGLLEQDFAREVRQLTETMEKRHQEAMDHAVKMAFEEERKKIEQEKQEIERQKAELQRKSDELLEKSWFKKIFRMN